MRLFIALEAPVQVQFELARLQGLARAAVHGSFPKTFHLTLKFLGEVAGRDVPDLERKLSAISFEPFELSLEKIGHFGSAKFPRILWVCTTSPSALLQLVKDLDAATPHLGDAKSFKSHLTLARVKSVKDAAALESVYAQTLPALSWRVDHATLYQSTLRPEGPVYAERLRLRKG